MAVSTTAKTAAATAKAEAAAKKATAAAARAAAKAAKLATPAKAPSSPAAGTEAPAAPVAPVQPATPAASPLAGYTNCGLLRAMGYAGFSAKQGALACLAIGKPAKTSTVSCQLGAGRQYAAGTPKPHHQGPITPLSPAALAVLVAAVGEPAKPHATVAPLPVATPKGPAMAALVAGSPEVAKAQAALEAAIAAARK